MLMVYYIRAYMPIFLDNTFHTQDIIQKEPVHIYIAAKADGTFELQVISRIGRLGGYSAS